MSTSKRKGGRKRGARTGPAQSPAAERAGLDRALHLAIARFAHRPEVTGVDLGYKFKDGQMTRQLAVRVHVREKFARRLLTARELLPRTFEGLPLDVIQTNCRKQALEPQASILGRRQRQDIVQGGLSVAAVGGPVGTFGVPMFDLFMNAPCVLSAQHVLYGGTDPAPGAPVVQPALGEHGSTNDVFARLTAFDQGTDAAIAALDLDGPGARQLDRAMYFSNVVLVGAREPAWGDVLEKSGRSTGLTRAMVDGIGLYEGFSSAIHLVPLPGEADPMICRPGDSGAIWYDATTGEAVGLHCLGPVAPNPLDEFAIATKMVKVMRNLQLAFVT